MTRDQRLVLSIAVLASFVTFLDGSVINVALPAISRELGGGITVQQWVVDAYLITLGTLILLAGSLSDTFGRMLVLKVGLVGFAVTSLLIAVSPSAEFLIVLRGLQGVAGALLVPSSLALIISSFRDAAQAKAIGTWTGFTSAAFLVGPLLGGLFVDYLSWRLVFAINIIPIAVTLVLIARLGQKNVRPEGGGIDWFGAVLGIVGLGGPVFALIEQANFGWGSPVIFLPFALGIVAFVWFVLRQRTTKHPMIPLGLFAVRNFSVGNVATTLVYAALSLGGFLITVFLQEVGEYSATAAGLALLPMTIISIVLSSTFGALAGKYGPRLFMGLGPIIGGIGYLLMLGIGEDVDYLTQVLPGVVVFAFGLTMTVAPLTAAILGSIAPEQSGIGSAINNAVSRIAGLIAIAFIGVILGSNLTVDSFHRGLVVTAALLIAGGVVSLVGIRNSARVATPVD
ncbi:EmrB/QacA subfamily drug resistance transporter [Conyzicola lurida]|uniref:EmrB/QacA subfamily drug resistance transporter n=1 Tax=Conyzicola lurida TaxID=1172621 RepID=A0A841AMA5_9MICO|nr:MFS transporter [Conyzicola lurida]MBB5843458.1 EmrB/QacA subfamily drug resistance transporter [Conyzicola lurida]